MTTSFSAAADIVSSLSIRWRAVWALWRQSLWPAPLAVDGRERLRIALGAALGIGLVAWVAQVWPPAAGLPWLMAPLGASAVLLFALPASPLAQPWAVLGGNTLSALVGVACVAWVPNPALAAGLAVGGAIGLMLVLRCLHPPGGAVALLSVVAWVQKPQFILSPVLLDSALLLLLAGIYNPLTGRRYPHPPSPAAPNTPTRAYDFSEADLDAVLTRYNQVLDVPRDDLRELLQHAEQQAQQRRLRTLCCSDVMTPNPVTAHFGTALDEAWALLRQHRIKAMPVVDRYGHVIGIVTRADFLRAAGVESAELPILGAGLDERLRRLLRSTPATHADKPEVVGQIMTRQVRVTSADRPLADLMPLFAHEGHHHLPVIGPDRRVLGILTQTDVVAALARL